MLAEFVFIRECYFNVSFNMLDVQSNRQQINSGDAFSIMLLFKECGAF